MRPHHLISLLCAGLLLPLSGGCALFGLGAAKLLPPQRIEAAYKGLAGQSVGVMVWADKGTRIDYPDLQLNTANSIQNKLAAAQQQDKPKELKGTTFPVKPASIARYQLDHPQIEAMQLTDVAPKLGVTRLIYVEVEGLTTRPQAGVELFRGEMVGTLKVVEIAPNKTAKVAYEENNVRAAFPKKSPADGIPNADDYRISLGTVDEFTTEVIHRFLEHEEEEQ